METEFREEGERQRQGGGKEWGNSVEGGGRKEGTEGKEEGTEEGRRIGVRKGGGKGGRKRGRGGGKEEEGWEGGRDWTNIDFANTIRQF